MLLSKEIASIVETPLEPLLRRFTLSTSIVIIVQSFTWLNAFRCEQDDMEFSIKTKSPSANIRFPLAHYAFVVDSAKKSSNRTCIGGVDDEASLGVTTV